MISKVDNNRLTFLLLPIGIFIIGCILHFSRGYYGVGNDAIHAQGIDDAYISYRYGWNLTHYGTLSWNESGYRQTEGFTNPLWVLASAIWSLPGHKEWVYPLSVLTSILISVLFLFLLCRQVYLRTDNNRITLSGVIMVSATPVIWLHATSGLESTVFGIGLALLAYIAVFDNEKSPKPFFIIIITIFLGLLRSDGFIYIGFIWLGSIIARSSSWKSIFVGMVVSSSILFLWRYSYFGTLFPNTAIAKVNFSIIERLPVGLTFTYVALIFSGLSLYIFLGVAGLWIEKRRYFWAGLFIIISWLFYYIYIGGDAFIERHLIGLFFLTAAFSAPLWNVAKPLTRGLFLALFIMITLLIMSRSGSRFNYQSPKLPDPWIILGQGMNEDREKYGVLITYAAGKIPFFADGDCIDALGLNDPLFATIKREAFIPGHSSGSDAAAIELAQQHPSGVYSTFSYLDDAFIKSKEDISLWVDNYHPQAVAQNRVTQEEWEAAKATNNIFIWSIISNPIRYK